MAHWVEHQTLGFSLGPDLLCLATELCPQQGVLLNSLPPSARPTLAHSLSLK